MNVNPYLVINQLFGTAEALQDELNKQFNNGYELVQIFNNRETTTVVFVMKTAAAQLRNASAVAGGFGSR